MRRVSKAIVISGVVVVVLALAGWVALNLYLKAPGTQARIQREMSEALRLPVVLTESRVTPWGALRINGITIPTDGGNWLDAASFSARFRLLPLLRKELVIYDMSIDQPKIVWAQNAEGKWEVPPLIEAPENAAEEKPDTEASGGKDFQVLLDGLKVNGGTVEFLDKEGHRVALLSDVTMNYSSLTKERVEGTFAVGRLNYADALFVDNVRSPFVYADNQLQLPGLEATWAGGALNGTFQIAADGAKSPFAAQLTFSDVDAARLTADAKWAPGKTTGKLGGRIDVHGSTREIARMEGRASLTLADAHFSDLDLFAALGQALQMEQFSRLNVKSGRAEIRIADEKAFVERLELEAPGLILSAKGVAKFENKLSLDARLAVRDVDRLPEYARGVFHERDADGLGVVDFKISGRVDRPKTNLAEQLLGRSLTDQFDSLVSKFLGFGDKKEGRKKDKDKEREKKRKAAEKNNSALLPPAAETPPVSTGGRPKVAEPEPSTIQ